jgi:hypothetical protein
MLAFFISIPIQRVPTNKSCGLNYPSAEVFSIQLNLIKFVIDLRQGRWFVRDYLRQRSVVWGRGWWFDSDLRQSRWFDSDLRQSRWFEAGVGGLTVTLRQNRWFEAGVGGLTVTWGRVGVLSVTTWGRVGGLSVTTWGRGRWFDSELRRPLTATATT